MIYSAVVASKSSIRRLSEVAQDQWGLITRRQALELAGLAPATLARLAEKEGVLDRVAKGVYHLAGAPVPDHADLRAAWLQLAPRVPAWERTSADGIVSHRSAAALYGIGDLPADRHEFTFPVGVRRQPRRRDVRVHNASLADGTWINLRGLPVTRPSRIAADLLADHEEPEAVARIVTESLHHIYDYPRTVADALVPYAARLGFRKGDGPAALRWLLDLAGAPDTADLMHEARPEGPSQDSKEHSNRRPPGVTTP